MTLEHWCIKNGISDADLARMIGVQRMSAYRYRKGQRVPRPAIVARIVEATGGAVTVSDLYRAHQARAQAAAGGKEAA